MRRIPSFTVEYLKSKKRQKLFPDQSAVKQYLETHDYAGRHVMTAQEANDFLARMVYSENPFFAGRFGATELSTTKIYDFEIRSRYETMMHQMKVWSGFFPEEEEQVMKFKDLMLSSVPEADLLGVWMQPFEEYYIRRYAARNMKQTFLFSLEPWTCPERPWSRALANRKVLVIHPFSETIERQYERRNLLFPGTDILPPFELRTLKAVQTVAEENDPRFETWFDALEWMFDQAMQTDFDIALIGCGAYGFPLAAKLKKAGKSAVHLGGALQLLFGIRGKRWDEDPQYDYIRTFFNDFWVYPDASEKPSGAQKVEGGCYW